jgi:hypothetical protein
MVKSNWVNLGGGVKNNLRELIRGIILIFQDSGDAIIKDTHEVLNIFP